MKRTVLIFKHFKVEEREDGWHRVVAFTVNPKTHEAVRVQPDPPWSPPLPGRWIVLSDTRRPGDAGQVRETPPMRIPEG